MKKSILFLFFCLHVCVCVVCMHVYFGMGMSACGVLWLLRIILYYSLGLSIAVIKHHDQKFQKYTASHYSPPSKEVRAGSQAGLEPGGRTEAEAAWLDS